MRSPPLGLRLLSPAQPDVGGQEAQTRGFCQCSKWSEPGKHLCRHGPETLLLYTHSLGQLGNSWVHWKRESHLNKQPCLGSLLPGGLRSPSSTKRHHRPGQSLRQPQQGPVGAVPDQPRRPKQTAKPLKIKLSLEPQLTKVGHGLCGKPKQSGCILK